jgi:aarF domain-containing kinase
MLLFPTVLKTILIFVIKIRVFLVTAKYCMVAVWRDEKARIFNSSTGLVSFMYHFMTTWWAFQRDYYTLTFVEIAMDMQGYAVKFRAWLYGLRKGVRAAHDAAAGLTVNA